MNHNGKSRDDLARQANLVRSKLLRTVEQLDQRRHEVLDVRLQVERHVRKVVIASGILIVATAAGVSMIVHRIATTAERRRRERWTLARDMWRYPARAMRGERRSFFGQLLRSVLLSVVTAAVTVPARRLIVELVEPRPSTPR